MEYNSLSHPDSRPNRGQFHEALRLTTVGLSDQCRQQMHSLVIKPSFSKTQGPCSGLVRDLGIYDAVG